MSVVLDAIQSIPQLPQTQASLSTQLLVLSMAANRLGLYDAALYLRSSMATPPRASDLTRKGKI